MRDAGDLAERAAAVLRKNDMGSWTRAAPSLYPHQWSWDSAFIAIGLARLDTRRAALELRRLLRHQRRNGRIPHIVFNPEAPPESYFPGPEHWSVATTDATTEGPAQTSGLCQPPVHAIAARRILEVAEERDDGVGDVRAFLREAYPRLFAWHRYLATERDPEGSGLVTIFHPWESGTDDSPRWHEALMRVEVGEMPPYPRPDLANVPDPSERPAREVYDRFIWLVELVKRARYDDREIYASHPFLAKDVLMSAILVRANEALLEIAEVAEAPDDERARVEAWASRGREGLYERWDEDFGLCLDYDLRADEPLKARTVAAFAPLVSGSADAKGREALLRTLDSGAFCGHPALRWPLPPSTSPAEGRFHPRSYWRGPVWPVINWLLWWSLQRSGERERAARLRRDGLVQLASGEFGEYYEPFTGEPLGSDEQSWTAAVALDWLAVSEDSRGGSFP